MNFNITPFIGRMDTVDYVCLEGPSFRTTYEGMEAEAVFGVATANLFEFEELVYGRIIEIDTGGGQSIFEPMYVECQRTPLRFCRLYADSYTVEPHGAMDGSDVAGDWPAAGARGLTTSGNAPSFRMTNYNRWRVRVHFTDRDPFVEETLDLSGQVVTIRTDDLRYKSTLKTLNEMDRIWYVQSLGRWNYSVIRTRAVPDALWTMKGKVNSVAMKTEHIRDLSSGKVERHEFAAGTVLFEDVELIPTPIPFGSYSAYQNSYRPYCRMNLHFCINKDGFNKWPCPQDGTTTPVFDTLQIKNGAGWSDYSMYHSANLNDLLFNPAV